MVVNLDTHRRLKALKTRLEELGNAIEAFEGDLAELGVLRAKFYATSYRAAELQREIKSGDDQ